MSRDSLIAEGNSIPWFHAMNFGDWVSPGRFSADRAPNITLFPIFHFLKQTEINGKSVLDIGTADGLVAYGLEKLGASRVVATDGITRRPFEIAHKLLQSNVEYISGLHDTHLLPRAEELGQFDIVICAGFLYHLFGPLHTIAACRSLVKPGGLLLVESVYTGGEEPTMTLNTELDPPLTSQQSSYWIGTKSAYEGMLKLCCFDILGTASIGTQVAPGKAGRLGLVARAVAAKDVRDRKPQTIRTQTMLAGTPEIKFNLTSSPENNVAYSGAREHAKLSMSDDHSWFPFQPSWKP